MHNVIVVGDFGIKLSTIEKAVEITNSEFQGKLDFRYCGFKQVVDFSGYT